MILMFKALVKCFCAGAFSFRSGRRNEAFLRTVAHDNFAVPWLPDDPAKRLDAMSFDAIVAMSEAMPPGVPQIVAARCIRPIQRRATLCAGAIPLLPQAAAESKPAEDARADGTRAARTKSFRP